MKKTLSIVLCVLLVLLAVACSPESSTHVHEWEKTSESTATCEKDGSETWTCKICKESEVRPVEATGHTHASNVAGTAAKDANENELKVTCSENGLYTFRCTTCGKSFDEVVTPEQAKASGLYKSELKHVYLKNGKYTPYDTENLSDKSEAKYYPSDIAEATMFTAKSKQARCASCGDLMPEYNVVADETAEFKLINGTWVYEGIKDDKAFEKVYLDITQKKETSGSVTTTAGYIISTYNEKTGWTTTEYNKIADVSTLLKNGENGKRSLYYQYDGKYYTISEDTNGWVVKYSTSPDMSNAKNALEKDSNKDKGTIDFKEGHNHKYDNSKSCIYNLSSAEEAVNIYCDTNFKLMTFLGMPYCDGTNHYVECKECGISYYPVACKTGTSGKTDISDSPCKLCGYTKKDGSYYTLTIARKATSLTDGAAEAALAAAKRTYAGAQLTSSSEKKETLALLEAAKTAVNDANDLLKKLGYSESSNERKALVALLEDNKESKSIATSIVDAYNDCSGLATDTTKITNYTAYNQALKACSTALAGADDPSSKVTADSETGNKVTDGASFDISTYIKNNTKEIESFEVVKNSSLNLNDSNYTSFRGVTFDFANNSGWSWNDGEKISYKSNKYIVAGDNAVLTFVTKY